MGFVTLKPWIAAFIGAAFARPQTISDPGWDLASYISRPELRAPLLNITLYEADLITTGYWFVAPYAYILPASLGNEYVPFQVGPFIYDNTGELVWSGAQLFENRNAFDFRLTTVNDSQALTFILGYDRRLSSHPEGGGMILDSSFQVRDSVNLTQGDKGVDIHEFQIIDGGKTSLSTCQRPRDIDVSKYGLDVDKISVLDTGFREIDLSTAEVIFEWWSMDHLALNESMLQLGSEHGTKKEIWDCTHVNSIDKNQDGDYLVSMRYTDAIYKISGKDGSIIWRLGGKLSDFVQDFNFSSQHDAKFHISNSSMTIFSFFDNASDERNRQAPTANTSAVKMVALYENTSPMTAKLLQQFDRPDGNLTKLRGSAQWLPNGGIFAGWSDQGYMTEFAPDGRCVLEAKYAGDRFNSYRAYKFDFVGHPSEPPALKTQAYGGDSWDTVSTVFAVSWNGATEVGSWTFYGTNDLSRPYENLGSVIKSGFETTFSSHGFWAFSYAQAIAANGTTLGSSLVEDTILASSQIRNITSMAASRTDQSFGSLSNFIATAMFLVGIVLGGLLSGSFFFWRNSSSRRESVYTPVRVVDDDAEIEEMAPLKYDDKVRRHDGNRGGNMEQD